MRLSVVCALLGAPSAAGAALFGRSALLAAESSPDDPFNSWAVQASSEMESKYTCNVSAILPRFEHESWEQTGDSWGKDFLLPPNTHLLLYGTSQIRSVRQVLVSMARYQGTFERTRLVDISDHCGSGSGQAKNFLDRVLAEAALEALTCVPGTCAMCGIQKQKCKHADHTVDYFAGNSTVTTISDMAQYQKLAHLGALEGLLNKHEPSFTNAYFWAPNDESYFDMQCAKLAVSRDPLTVQKLTRAFQGATQAQCDLDDEECRHGSPYFQAIRKAVPSQALGFVGRPKKRATELEEMSGYFETQQEEAWCNVVCMESDATKCSPSAGVPFAWEVLRSAGVLREPEPEMVVAAPPAEKAAKPKAGSHGSQQAKAERRYQERQAAQQQQSSQQADPNDAMKEIMEKAEAEQKALADKASAKEQAERDEVQAEKEAYDKAAAAAEFEEAQATAKEATAAGVAKAAAAAAEKAAAETAATAAAAAVEKEAAAAEKKALATRVADAEAEAVGKVAKAEARAAAAEQRADAETSAAAAKKSKAQAAAAAVASAAASVAAQAAKEEMEMETEKKALAKASAEENRKLGAEADAKIEAAEERAAQAEARAEAEALAAQKAKYDAAAAAEEKAEVDTAAKADADLKVAEAEARVAEAEGKAEAAVASAEKRVAEAEAKAEAQAVKQEKVAAQAAQQAETDIAKTAKAEIATQKAKYDAAAAAAAAAEGVDETMAVPQATAPGDAGAPSAPSMKLPGFEAEAKAAEAKAKAAQRREAEAEARAKAAEEREAVVKAEAQAEAAEAQAEAAEAKAEAAEAKAAAKDEAKADAKATAEAQAEAAEAKAEAAEAQAEAAEAKADASTSAKEQREREEIAAEKAAYDKAEAKADAQAQEDATAEATAKAAAEAAEAETADALAEADEQSASSAQTKAEAEAQAAEAEAEAAAGFVDVNEQEAEAAAAADVRIARAEAAQAEGAQATGDSSEQQAAVQQVSSQQATAEAQAARQSEAQAQAEAMALSDAAGVPLVPMTPFEQAQAASQKAADDAKLAWEEAAAEHELTSNAEAARNTKQAAAAQNAAEKLRADKVKADAEAAAARESAVEDGVQAAWKAEADTAANAAEAQWEAQSQMQANQQEAIAGVPFSAGPSRPMASLANPPAFSYGKNPADSGLMGQDGEVPEVFVPLQGASPQQARSVKMQPPHLAVPQLQRADESDDEGMQQQGVAASATHRRPKVLVGPLDAAAEGPPQKPLSLPSVYYINMDEETDMKKRIEHEMGPYTNKLVRVPAVDKARVGACLDDGSCSRDPSAKVLGRDFLNTDGFLYWELHEKNIFSPGEFGCTFSHLRAAYQAYIDDEQTALIIEDDVSLEDMSHWPETIQDIVAEAPPDWGILQLWTNNPAFYKFYQRGQSVDEVPADAKNGFDPNSATCEANHYNRPAFVPWYDDVFENTGQYYGGLWSTMAYLINRKGMNSIITKLGVGPNRLGNLTLPVLADHLVFQVAKTYTYTRPLFRAFSRESTIQPSFHEGDAKIDPTKGRVESGDDPHWATDGLTNKFINQYWSDPLRSSQCPLTAAERSPLKLVVLATAAFSEAWIHDGNIEKLARGVEGTRVVLYAINAIDNKVADWHTGWTQKAERLGIANMVVSSKRNLDRGFESKLVSQLPLLNHIKQRVSYDYIFTIDGDISFAGADVHGLFRSIRSARPLIAQPTIRVPASLVGGNMFSWGSQWYKALNHDQASTCGSATEYDSPMIESQAAILSKTFLDWYHDELEQVARVQHEYQCDWGHDEMWCSAAARLSEKLPHSPPACVIIRHSVDHHDTKSIQKYQMHTNGGNFLSDCQTMEKAFQKDNIGGDGGDKGKVTRISIAALRDHTNLTCVNQWADLNGGGCKPPSHDNEQYSAVKSYRAFMQGQACHDLQDEKAAAEESYALTKLRRPNNPFISERVMGVPGAAGAAGAASVVPGAGAGVGAAADMLSKGRREFGPHFTPKMPLTQAPVAPVPPARSAVSEADLPTGLESLRKALRGPHQ